MANVPGIEVQLWHQGPAESIFLGKGLTNDSGEFVVDILIDSPVDFIEDGQISNVVTKMYYNGELLEDPSYLYDPDALAYFAELTPQPSRKYKAAINTLVKQLKAGVLWTHLDHLWIFATEYQQHAGICLKSPSTTPATEVNSPSWYAGSGYVGNGSSSYVNLNVAPNSCVQFTQNNASYGAYSRTNTNQNSIDFGSMTSGNCTVYYPRYSTNLFYGYLNNTGSASGNSNTNSSGLMSIKRVNSSGITVYRNGVSLGTESQTSVAPNSYNLFVLAGNLTGSPTSYSSRQISIAFIGGAVDQAALFDVIQTFATTIGFAVF